MAWCNVPCNGPKTACTVLTEISGLAHAAGSGITPGQLTQLTTLITKCTSNLAPTTLSEPQHCQKVNAAKAAADVRNWMLCITQMQHGH